MREKEGMLRSEAGEYQHQRGSEVSSKKNYFKTCNQRNRRRIKRKCYVGIQDQRMLRRVVKKVKCCRKVRLRTGKPISFNI